MNEERREIENYFHYWFFNLGVPGHRNAGMEGLGAEMETCERIIYCQNMLSFSCLFWPTFRNILQAGKHQKRDKIERDTVLFKWKYRVPVTFQFQTNDFFLLSICSKCYIVFLFLKPTFLFISNASFTGCPIILSGISTAWSYRFESYQLTERRPWFALSRWH